MLTLTWFIFHFRTLPRCCATISPPEKYVLFLSVFHLTHGYRVRHKRAYFWVGVHVSHFKMTFFTPQRPPLVCCHLFLFFFSKKVWKKWRGQRERESQRGGETKTYSRKRELKLARRKVNHVYFWDCIAWALAVHFIILQSVICVHSQWVTAPIFLSLLALGITVQQCVILMCSLLLSSTLLSWTVSLCTCLQAGQWSQSHKSSDTYVFPVKWPAIFPRTRESGQRARLCGTASHPVVLTAPALPKVWPQEVHSSSKSIRDSSITETGVQTNVVFLGSLTHSAN